MLNINRTQRKDFKRHFISNAFLEVRFPAKKFDWDNIESRFKQVTAGKLGLNIGHKAFTAQLRVNAPSKQNPNQSVESYTETIGLIAQDKENNFSIQLQSDRLIFSTRKYAGFTSFWTQVETAIALIKNEFQITHAVWFGIRKINDIFVTNETGVGYVGEGVNRQIFSPIKDGVFAPSAISRGFNRYELKEGNTNCIVDIQVSKVSEKDYSLKVDLDVNEQSPPLEIDKIRENIFRLNDKIFDVFVWSVSDDVIAALEAP